MNSTAQDHATESTALRGRTHAMGTKKFWKKETARAIRTRSESDLKVDAFHIGEVHDQSVAQRNGAVRIVGKIQAVGVLAVDGSLG